MVKQKSMKKALITTTLILATLLLITPTHNLAIQPENVDVTIRITWFDPLIKDKDVTSAADVYFKIIHDSGTQLSDTAWNDYEDEADYELDNTDFDGNGYYNEQYWDIDLDTGDLTWTIEAWDEDNIGADDLLFSGILTIKDPGTSGSHSDDDVFAQRVEVKIDFVWVTVGWNTHTDYLRFEWDDGAQKTTATHRTSNGMILWISLYYSI